MSSLFRHIISLRLFTIFVCDKCFLCRGYLNNYRCYYFRWRQDIVIFTFLRWLIFVSSGSHRHSLRIIRFIDAFAYGRILIKASNTILRNISNWIDISWSHSKLIGLVFSFHWCKIWSVVSHWHRTRFQPFCVIHSLSRHCFETKRLLISSCRSRWWQNIRKF